jgi:twin arginine-targeting protein translocase TatB
VFLLIGESIGWQELLLIGVLALIFLGPRKLPELARTVGKTMADLKRMGNEFRETWEREVALEEEEKKFLQNPLDENLILAEDKYRKPAPAETKTIPPPEIKEVSQSFDGSVFSRNEPQKEKAQTETPAATAAGKQDWL